MIPRFFCITTRRSSVSFSTEKLNVLQQSLLLRSDSVLAVPFWDKPSAIRISHPASYICISTHEASSIKYGHFSIVHYCRIEGPRGLTILFCSRPPTHTWCICSLHKDAFRRWCPMQIINHTIEGFRRLQSLRGLQLKTLPHPQLLIYPCIGLPIHQIPSQNLVHVLFPGLAQRNRCSTP